MIGQNQNLLWQLLKTTDKTQFTTSFLTSQPSHINQIETNTTSTKVNITIIFKKSHKTPIYLKSRLIIVYLEVIDKQNKYKLKKRIWKYLEKERRAELRRREGAAKCAATRELWSARIWERGFESARTPFQRLWERAEMSELCLEMRKGFRTLREGRTTPYRRDKTKNAGAVSERRRLGKKKKKEKWTTSFKDWKSPNRPNRPNRSRFTEPDGQTVVRTVPCFFGMERFLTLNRPWIWTVHGFSGPTVRSGPGSITLIVGSRYNNVYIWGQNLVRKDFSSPVIKK